MFIHTNQIIAFAIFSSLVILFIIMLMAWFIFKYLQTSLQKQREIAEAVNIAQENERQSIARDIHDNFGNICAVIMLELSELERSKANTDVAYALTNIIELFKKARIELKKNINDLAPVLAHQNDWIENIENYSASFSAKKVQFNIGIHGLKRNYRTIAQTNLFRIFQELITNALKYAEATEISLDVTFTDKNLEILFADNGKGIPEDMPENKGFGLKNILARSTSMHGTCRMHNGEINGLVWKFKFEHRYLV